MDKPLTGTKLRLEFLKVLHGPLFFLIYINDLPSELRCSAKLFADDTYLFSVVENVNETTANLNKHLENINKWAQQ